MYFSSLHGSTEVLPASSMLAACEQHANSMLPRRYCSILAQLLPRVVGIRKRARTQCKALECASFCLTAWWPSTAAYGYDIVTSKIALVHCILWLIPCFLIFSYTVLIDSSLRIVAVGSPSFAFELLELASSVHSRAAP